VVGVWGLYSEGRFSDAATYYVAIQAIQVYAWTLPRVRPQTLRFTPFQIQYSLIILQLGEI
jgi:hypothetical protein